MIISSFKAIFFRVTSTVVSALSGFYIIRVLNLNFGSDSKILISLVGWLFVIPLFTFGWSKPAYAIIRKSYVENKDLVWRTLFERLSVLFLKFSVSGSVLFVFFAKISALGTCIFSISPSMDAKDFLPLF